MALKLAGLESLARRVAIRRARRELQLDRRTLALSVVSGATVAAVFASELARRGRLRAEHDSGVEGLVATAQQAAADTVTVTVRGYEDARPAEAALFNMLSGFVGAFAWARVSTYGMRRGWWPLGNVEIGGRHIHHFVPGILLAFMAGAAALLTENEQLEPALAWPFGVGLGLTLDEAALLLELQDVYWSREGILSVQVSSATASALGAAVLAMRLLRRGERRATREGLIPEAG